MKALVGAFNPEKALVGAFSVIVQPVVEPMEHYTALIVIVTIKLFAGREMEWDGGWWDWMVVNQPPTGTVHRNDSTTLRSIPQMKRSIVEMLG